MKYRTRVFLILGLVAIIAMVSAGATMAAGSGDSKADQARIDDGAELLGQASISLDEAIAAAKAAVDGKLDEIDLEKYQGRLVFNIDVGNKDVKVDASNGTVLGFEMDDKDDDKDDGPDEKGD